MAIQYSDESLNRLYIQVFCRYAFTREITIYPAVSSPANYVMGDRVISSEELMNKGISVSVSDNDCKVLELHNEK